MLTAPEVQFFDIIVFAGIAAFLIYRLRNVLGKRSGFEKKIGKPQPKKQKNNLEKNIEILKTIGQTLENRMIDRLLSCRRIYHFVKPG